MSSRQYHRVDLDVTLVVQAPVLPRSSVPGPPGVDTPVMRDSQGRCMIPRSHVKGRLLQALEELPPQHCTSSGTIARLLGKGAEGLEPRPGALHVTDFLAQTAEAGGVRARIRRDPETGIVDAGALAFVETPFGAGARVSFEGTLSQVRPGEDDGETDEPVLQRGLRWMPCVGGLVSSGFGRILDVTTQRRVVPAVPLPLPDQDRIGLSLRILEPFIVSKRPVAPNMFESREILSGGVLRGLLARRLRQAADLAAWAWIDEAVRGEWAPLASNFNRIAFSHFLPADPSASFRPVEAPLSLVADDAGHLIDVALASGGTPLGPNGGSPAFAADWKGGTWAKARAAYGWPPPLERELRVRTRVDRGRRRAQDGDLFGFEMIVPGDHRWLGSIDVSEVPEDERASVLESLRWLLGLPLDGLGKTGARVEVAVDDRGVAPHTEDRSAPTAAGDLASSREPLDGRHVLTLQTPALLLDPRPLDETSGEQALQIGYEGYWSEASDGALSLERHFSALALRGGYLAERFRRGLPVNPFLLTDRGSVFVLRPANGRESEARRLVESWMRHGLPLPSWCRELHGGDTSRNFPFSPADGYGEISANCGSHALRLPRREVPDDA